MIEKKTLKYTLILLFFSLSANLGTFTLHHEEPRRGIITFEMLKTGDFFQPTVLGQPYFKKPPLHEWATSLTSFIVGHVSEFTLRFPSVLAVLLTSLLIYFFGKRFLDRKVALFGALIYPTFFVVLFGYSTKCEPDVIFSLAVSLSIFSWFYFMKKNRVLTAWIVGYFFASLALLTKGLPAVHFFYISVISYAVVWRKELKKILTPFHLLGAIIGLIPFAAWLFTVNTEKALLTLIYEVIARAPEHHSIAFIVKKYLSFPFRLIAATVPWSLIVVYYYFKKRLSLKPVLGNEIIKFLLLSSLLNIAVYWVFPGSRLRYVIPALPMLSIVLAYILKDFVMLHKRAKKSFQFFLEISVPILIVAGLVVSHNSSLILKETIAFLAFSYFLYFYVLPKINFTSLVTFTFLFMVLFRGIYSCYYIPIAQFKYPPYRAEGKRVAEITKSFPLFTKTKYLQFCFYVETFRDKILKFTDNPPKTALFLSEKPEANVLYTAKVGKKKFYVCSYSVKKLPLRTQEKNKREVSR